MSAGAQLTQFAKGSGPKKIINPGGSLIRAAQPLIDPKRTLGKFEYQWLAPGPNSRMAVPNGSVAIPAATVADPLPQTVVVVNYEVPEGYRFVLTDIAIGALAPDWSPGNGQLTFTLLVKYSTGPRNVEYLATLPFNLGTLEIPWPLRGRLEFSPLDVLQVVGTNVSLVTPGASDVFYGALNGFTYPAMEGA